MRVVLDTNVLVSGLIHSAGKPGRVLALGLSGSFQIVYCSQILGEYSEVLARPKFKFEVARVGEVLNKIETDGELVDISGQPIIGLPDPDDEPFLVTALIGKTDFLITGNIADFPTVKRHSCRIVNPAEFLQIWDI